MKLEIVTGGYFLAGATGNTARRMQAKALEIQPIQFPARCFAAHLLPQISGADLLQKRLRHDPQTGTEQTRAATQPIACLGWPES